MRISLVIICCSLLQNNLLGYKISENSQKKNQTLLLDTMENKQSVTLGLSVEGKGKEVEDQNKWKWSLMTQMLTFCR